MRLRRRRAALGARRSRRWPLPLPLLLTAMVALLVGAACLAPLASSALAPIASGALAPMLPGERLLAASVARSASRAGGAQPVAAVAMTPTPLLATSTPAPLARPTPAVVPTLSSGGRALLAGITADRAAPWVRNHTETPLLSGPTADAVLFTRLPQWSLLKQVDSRPDWLMVNYSGDGDTRQPGVGWVRAGDVGRVDAPTVWLNTATVGSLWSAADASATRLLDVPPATLMEVVGPDAIAGTRVHVRLPGNGRSVPPAQGWLAGDALARAQTPSYTELPRAYPDDLGADVRIQVPYRTQLDGSDYASANCGPTVLGMALETFGMDLSPTDLRGQVLASEDISPQNDDAGSYIWALARVAQSHGLQTHGLYESDGSGLHRWSVDEIRDSLRQRQPVIVQVVYRGLPGREDSGYYEDHFIIITGLLGDNFLYNDPIGGTVAHESPGYDREMTPTQLARAMRASATAYAYTAFGLSRS